VCEAQPGPEQCEGAQGLLPNYICVSTRPEDHKPDKKTASSCLVDQCRQGCSGSATLCFNDPQVKNPNGSCNSALDLDCDGISDTCDPDRDADGVPTDLDCNDLLATVHGAYLNQPAAQELCSDGVDNDCDGFKDNVALVNGNVKDLLTGNPIAGATVIVRCGTSQVGTGTTSANGSYSVSAQVFSSCGTYDVYAQKPTGDTPYCFSDYLKAQAAVHLCSVDPQPAIADTVYMVPQPPPSGYVVDYTWTPKPINANLQTDFELRYQGNYLDAASSPLFTLDTYKSAPGHRALPYFTSVGSPDTLMKLHLREISGADAKGKDLVMHVWPNACQNVTTITADETGAPQQTTKYWEGVLIKADGQVQPLNKFSTNTPSFPPPS
jgi:hypothetical protein